MKTVAKVEQFNGVANQFLITVNEGPGKTAVYFQSYQTVVAKKVDGRITLDQEWNYSRTTQKHLNRFLCTDKKEIENRIKSGEYKVESLNRW